MIVRCGIDVLVLSVKKNALIFLVAYINVVLHHTFFIVCIVYIVCSLQGEKVEIRRIKIVKQNFNQQNGMTDTNKAQYVIGRFLEYGLGKRP